MTTLPRRTFLEIGLTAAGGLLLGFRTGRAAPASFAPSAFLRIDTDGTVTFTAPVPEMGQGVRTSLCMLVAEELGVAPASIRLEQADGDETRYGPRQRAAGSATIRSYWRPLREAGATARTLLIAAAAEQWGVVPDSCRAEGGAVHHGGSGRRLPFGRLAARAAALPPPGSIRLKEPAEFTVIGQPTPNLDTPGIVTGQIQFGLDFARPGMIHAVIARCPVYGGRAAVVDDATARGVRGVLEIRRIEPLGPPGRPFMQGGVAVLAESTWAALAGRAALRVSWDEGPNAGESTSVLRARCAALVQNRGKPVRVAGDAYAELAGAARRLDAEYVVPFLAHAPLEPMNCVAEVSAERCEVWAPVQIPAAARTLVARVTGLPEASVTVHVLRMGGGFGRRLGADYAAEAAWLAKATGKPVQVVWSREDDMRHGFYRPYGHHRLSAALDPAGNLSAWVHRLASTSRYAFRSGADPAASELHPDEFPSNVLPHVSLEYALAESTVQRGPWRAPRDNASIFVTESFVDEIAHAAGRDPLALRLGLLAGDRELPYTRDDEAGSFSTRRLRGVLNAAAERAGWASAPAAGRARGLACCFSYGAYVAEIAEVSVDRPAGRLTVHRVTAAIDCGTVVNPSGVRAQVEGAVIDGVSSLYREITFEKGRVEQSNFSNYRMLRISEVPEIDVVLVPGSEAPTGAGEPPFPAVAPAITNAIFAATGIRVRSLPLTAKQLQG
jgi:isoquinoline 1-oxidoreductase beta subunit